MLFYLYSTDDADPAEAATVALAWQADTLESEYDPAFEWAGRGSDVPTLGGHVIQDYGVVEQDRKIRCAGWLEADEAAALEAAYIAGGEYHFTARKQTGVAAEVWKVQFRRVPRGFTAVLEATTFATGRLISEPVAADYERYRYELVLLVVAKIEDES